MPVLDAEFNTVDPLTVHDLRKQASTKDTRKALQTQVIILFAVSLFGLIAPFVLVFGSIWFLPRRKEAAKAGPVYLVFGYAGLAVAAVYCILFILFLAFFRD